jgi:hypothetical protein
LSTTSSPKRSRRSTPKTRMSKWTRSFLTKSSARRRKKAWKLFKDSLRPKLSTRCPYFRGRCSHSYTTRRYCSRGSTCSIISTNNTSYSLTAKSSHGATRRCFILISCLI